MSESQGESPGEPKIIVDDDWKAQVEKEKAGVTDETGLDADQGQADSAVAAGEPAKEVGQGSASEEMPAPPPASFEVMISMMFTQAMAMLGQIPDPATGQSSVNKPFAKHYIDTLEMLGEKTEGNLSDDESKMLSEAMHALRMAYVSAKA